MMAIWIFTPVMKAGARNIHIYGVTSSGMGGT